MKRKDLLILSNLRLNARTTLTDISKNTSIPVTTVYDHLKKYEKELIAKNACLLDFRKMGYRSKAKIALRVDNNHRDLISFLQAHPSVNSVYRLNSDFDANFDFMVEVICREPKDVDNFMKELSSEFPVTNSIVFNVAEDLKREEFLTRIHDEK